MTMTAFNGDPTQALKWMHNQAPNITSLLTAKKKWYDEFGTNFWSNWLTSVFDIRTANNFGLAVWCKILGLPQTPFNFIPAVQSWAYGPARENYVGDSGDTNPSAGGNFYGAGALNSLTEIRYALLLRYVALTHGGTIAEVNKMLRFIFNGGEPWDQASGHYAFAADCTTDTTVTNPPGVGDLITGAFQVQYRFGPALALSGQFIDLLNGGEYEILPTFSGSNVTAVQGT